MAEKIGRSDPCPCGSKKKYKKCCLKSDGTALHRMVDAALDWALNQRDLKEEFEQLLWKYNPPDTESGLEMDTLEEAFLFDHRLPDGKTALTRFREEAMLTPAEEEICKDMEEHLYSIFEVKRVYRGEGLRLLDLMGGGEYFVREVIGSYQTEPGHLLFCRLVKNGLTHVITTPTAESWPQEMAYTVKRGLSQCRADAQEERLTAFEVLNLIWKADDKPRSLEEVKTALKKKLKGLGIKVDFRGLKRRINTYHDPLEAFPEIRDFNFPSNEDYRETLELLKLLWNKHPRKEFSGKCPEEVRPMGPLEKSLASEMLYTVSREIYPEAYDTSEEIAEAVEAFKEKWLQTPQDELEGQTPLDAILEERRMLGNPDREIHYTIEVGKQPDFDVNKAENLYQEGLKAFKRGALIKASTLFEEVVHLYPENYKAWGNLGNCYALLGDTQQAIRSYKKALALEPGYEFAKRNLSMVKKCSKDELMARGVLGALTAILHDADEKKRGMELDVWKEIDERRKDY